MSFLYQKFVPFPFICQFVSESTRNSFTNTTTVLFLFGVFAAREKFFGFIDIDAIPINSQGM